jgi:hypothetical protein
MGGFIEYLLVKHKVDCAQCIAAKTHESQQKINLKKMQYLHVEIVISMMTSPYGIVKTERIPH